MDPSTAAMSYCTSAAGGKPNPGRCRRLGERSRDSWLHVIQFYPTLYWANTLSLEEDNVNYNSGTSIPCQSIKRAIYREIQHPPSSLYPSNVSPIAGSTGSRWFLVVDLRVDMVSSMNNLKRGTRLWWTVS